MVVHNMMTTIGVHIHPRILHEHFHLCPVLPWCAHPSCISLQLTKHCLGAGNYNSVQVQYDADI
jgi:hypothetical protein